MKCVTLSALKKSYPILDKMVTELCEMQVQEGNENAVALNVCIDAVEAARVAVLSLLLAPVIVDSNNILVVRLPKAGTP